MDERTESKPMGQVMSTGIAQSARGVALENLTVQWASRSFWHRLAGRFIHSAGTRPGQPLAERPIRPRIQNPIAERLTQEINLLVPS